MVRGDKTERLTIRISADEDTMLEDLAQAANVATTDIVRQLIRAEHERKFPKMNPGADIPATTRALLEDVGNPVHYTLRNIASRMRVPVGAVKGALSTLERKKIVDGVATHDNLDETWELIVPRDRAVPMAIDAGIDVDAVFHKHVLSFDLHIDEKGCARFGPVDPYTYGRFDADGKRALAKALDAVVKDFRATKVTTVDVAEAMKRELRKQFPTAEVDVYHSHQKGVTIQDASLSF